MNQNQLIAANKERRRNRNSSYSYHDCSSHQRTSSLPKSSTGSQKRRKNDSQFGMSKSQEKEAYKVLLNQSNTTVPEATPSRPKPMKKQYVNQPPSQNVTEKATAGRRKKVTNRKNRQSDFLNAACGLDQEAGGASDANRNYPYLQQDQLEIERQETQKPSAFVMSQDNRGASVNLTVNSSQTNKLVQYHSFADKLPAGQQKPQDHYHHQTAVPLYDNNPPSANDSLSIAVERIENGSALFQNEKHQTQSVNVKDQNRLDQLTIADLLHSQPPTERKLRQAETPSHSNLEQNATATKSFVGLEERRREIQEGIEQSHGRAATLIFEVMTRTQQLMTYIQEEKEELQGQNAAIEGISASQYVSQTNLLPSKQKVHKSIVPQVIKRRNQKGQELDTPMAVSASTNVKFLADHSQQYLNYPQYVARQNASQSQQCLHQSDSNMFSGAAHLTNQSQMIYPIGEEDEDGCNVIDDEQEAYGVIKAHQEDQADRLRDSQGRIADKISRADLCLQIVTGYLGQLSDQLEILEQQQVTAQGGIAQEIKDAKESAIKSHSRQESVRKAWENEIRNLSQVSQERAEQILRLQSQLYEVTLAKNEATHKLRKNENEIGMLNQALEAYGYLKPSGKREPNSLDSLKEVLNENERLKDEMRTLIEAAVRDRQIIEHGQRETMLKLPDLMNQQYKTLVEEYGRKMTKEQASTHHQLSICKKDLDTQRDRIIKLIEEKSTMEQDLNSTKLAKKEKDEAYKQKVRRVKELEIHFEVSKNKLDEANKKIEAKMCQIEELKHAALPLKEQIQKQKHEMVQVQIVLTKTESMKDLLDKDLREALQTQRSLSVKVETLTMEKHELKQLVEMKSHFIQGIQERGSLAASAGARLEDKSRQTLMYLETIQKLSMYIVRKQKSERLQSGSPKSEEGQAADPARQLDKETMENIKSLMDENVFDLLDKTETRVLMLQRENMELLEELSHFYQDQLTKEEQISVMFEILNQVQQVIEDLIPGSAGALSQDAGASPLRGKRLKHALPEDIINIFNKVYSRRFDFEKQAKKLAGDKQLFQKKIAICNSRLDLIQSMHGQEWHDEIKSVSGYTSREEKKEQINGKLRAKMEMQINELEITKEEQRMKQELIGQENTVLKQTVTKQKSKLKQIQKLQVDLDWLQERLDFIQKKWAQMHEKINQGVSQEYLLDFVQQVTFADSKIKRKALKKQSSEETYSIGQQTRSAMLFQSKSGLSEFHNGQDFSDYEHGDGGDTPLKTQRVLTEDELFFDDQRTRRQVTESPFNSPFQLPNRKSRLANTMIEEQAIGALQQQQEEEEPPLVMGDTQAHDLLAMLECQAYALEDIMKQKKQLAASVRQQQQTSVEKKNKSSKKRERSTENTAYRPGFGLDQPPVVQHRESKIGVGLMNVYSSSGNNQKQIN